MLYGWQLKEKRFVRCFCLAKMIVISISIFFSHVNLKVLADVKQSPEGITLKNQHTLSQFCKSLPDSRLFVRTELFFGLGKADGSEVSDLEFNRFLARAITPKFPDGLTLISGRGQFRSSNGKIIKESSNLLILIYPFHRLSQSDRDIQSIRQVYKQKFKQESVLRSDELSCVSF
jgi:Protein of unknown function (DUF3574)